jgi:hypothetical protein
MWTACDGNPVEGCLQQHRHGDGWRRLGMDCAAGVWQSGGCEPALVILQATLLSSERWLKSRGKTILPFVIYVNSSKGTPYIKAPLYYQQVRLGRSNQGRKPPRVSNLVQ